MKPGAVIVDVAIDQGGCVEGIRETTPRRPGLRARTASCTTPSATSPAPCPHTSTYALTNATLPYLVEVAVHGPDEACRRDPDLAHGLNTAAGQVVNPVVAAALADVTPA